jgi:selenide,water dikinase
MHAGPELVVRDVVLVGGGHSHVGVLRQFAMKPEPGVRLTLICRDTHTPYSGMLPGYIAGHYDYDQVHIDLRRLAEFAGARFYPAEAIGIDRQHQRVLCRERPPVPYDRLSINIGSTPRVGLVPGATEHAVPVKPIHQFNDRWQQLLQRVSQQHGHTQIAVVGGGAGGVELSLAMHYRLRHERQCAGRDPAGLHVALFTAGRSILPTHNTSVRQRFERILEQRNIKVHTQARVDRVASEQLHTADGQLFAADEIIWVTQAGGAPWLHDTGLKLGENGFLLVDDQLRCLNDHLIFAAGDVATIQNQPREKAGVFAVRMGPPLAKNLRRSVQGKALKTYRAQKRWLALISTGDRYAVASRGHLGFAGAWVWRWKDWIDRRFMEKFSQFPSMQAPPPPSNQLALANEEAAQAHSAVAMRCGGCGAKVGASVLSKALSQLTPIKRDDVLIGLHAPDDAAVVKMPPGKAAVHTVDFFRAFIDDPYVFGRIAANHALGDIFAMGAEAQTATAIATIPSGLEDKVADVVLQMMSGAVEVLNQAGCALVGGHTGEGKELGLGFAVNGLIDEGGQQALRKGGMQAGQSLILTKPIGTGTLFAAHAQLAARGRWVDEALTSMQLSNQTSAECLLRFGATACTDLTGFGLLGHLLEMTAPSGVDAELYLDALPVLAGAEETVIAGIVSSLQPANLRLRDAISNQETMRGQARFDLLFDPQTAGGLLASVPAERAQPCLKELQSLGYSQAAIIGCVLPKGNTAGPIRLRNSAS